MVRIILWFVILAGVAASVAWLADRPGDLVVNWLGYRIETSLAVALMALVVVLAVLWLILSLLSRLLHVPGAIADYVHNRSDRRGHEALSRGIVAVAARDREAAKRHSDRAVRLLPNDPLARLLEAQTAQLRGDNQRVERIFADMLGRPETEIVALRGLYIRARQAGNEARARGFAERAYRRQPSLDWASDAVVKTQAAQRDWPAVLAVLESQRRSKLLDENVYKRKRAVVLTAQAQEAEASDPDAALDLSGKALKLEPGLVPAAVLAARIHFARGYLKRGLKVVEKAWAINHHPDLADAYAHARPGESTRDRLARIHRLIAVAPGGEDGAVALARAAIEARDWKLARESIAEHASGRPRARVCVLMAEIEEGEFGDKGRAREWLSRAVAAPRDPAWVADGYVSERWLPVSPVTDELGAFVWKVPMESLGYSGPVSEPQPLPVIEAQPAAPPPRHSEPVPAPAPRPEPVAEPAPKPKPETVKLAQPATTGDSKPKPESSTDAAASRQPDDPGPDQVPESSWTRKLAGG